LETTMSRDPETRAASSAAYRARHPERVKASQAAYHAAHREEHNARSAGYFVAHHDAEIERKRVYAATHREERAAYGAIYRAANRERIRTAKATGYAAHRGEAIARAKAWAAAHPQQVQRKRKRQKAIRRGANLCAHESCRVLGPDSFAWQVNPHVCYICGTPVWRGVNLHMDHVVSIARGGVHCADNLRPACAACNLRKGIREA